MQAHVAGLYAFGDKSPERAEILDEADGRQKGAKLVIRCDTVKCECGSNGWVLFETADKAGRERQMNGKLKRILAELGASERLVGTSSVRLVQDRS